MRGQVKTPLILLICILVLSSMLPGCIEESHAFEIALSHIGDRFVYDVKTVCIMKFLSEEKKYYVNETMLTSINGSKPIIDGFGRERNAIEYYMQITGDSYTTSFSRYIDVETRTPLKCVLHPQNMPTIEAYPSARTYGILHGSFLSFLDKTLPMDVICGPFEGKSIRKGDEGTIMIFGKNVKWKAIGEETINGYRCIKIHFKFNTSYNYEYSYQNFSENMEYNYMYDYTLWFSNTFPQLIKMKVIIDTGVCYLMDSTSSESIMKSVMTFTLKSFEKGNDTISWGNGEPSFPEKSTYGDFGNWAFYPPTGNKSTNISFKIEDALDYVKMMNSSYFDQHPNSCVLLAVYSERGKYWNLIFGDETGKGYLVNLSIRNGGIEVTESKDIDLPLSVKLPEENTILTLSGSEDIARHFITLNENFSISFTINSSLLDIMKIYVDVPMLFKTVELGNFNFYNSPLYILFTDKESITIDGENGQVLLITRTL